MVTVQLKMLCIKVRVKCNFSDDNNKINNDSIKGESYVGQKGGHFEDRYTGHKYAFKHVNKKNITRLSDFVWQYFDRYGTKPEMKTSVARVRSSALNECQSQQKKVNNYLTKDMSFQLTVYTTDGSSLNNTLALSHIYRAPLKCVNTETCVSVIKKGYCLKMLLFHILVNLFRQDLYLQKLKFIF